MLKKVGVNLLKTTKNDNSVTEKLDIITKRVVKYLYGNKISVATAESCTGGMLSQQITSVAGASEIFGLGLCTYSNDAKVRILGVERALIEQYGAVSAQVAESMAKNVRRLSGADAGVGITGIAGPDGGTPEKPVGTVFVAVTANAGTAVRNLALYEVHAAGEFLTDREKIRKLTVIRALEMLEELCGGTKAEGD